MSLTPLDEIMAIQYRRPDELSAAYWAEQFDKVYLDTNVDCVRHAAVVKRLQNVLDMLYEMVKP